MENKDNLGLPEEPFDENEWFDSLLSKPVLGEEIGPDEQAISSAGLTHPSDAEVERIITETLSQDWGQEEEPEPAPPEPYQDREYRDSTSSDFLPEPEDPVSTSDTPETETPARGTSLPRRSSRKLRPSPKKGYGLLGIPHVLATAIWLVIALAIGVSLGRMVWLCAADVLALGRENQSVTFTVEQQDNVDTLASKLKKDGLVRYPELFKFYLRIADKEDSFHPGTFTLNTVYDYKALANALSYTGVSQEIVKGLMIPEGYTCAQIFSLLEEKGVCTVEELENYAANGELNDYWFLEGVERGDRYCLEGYLFPDTYDFYTNDDPGRVLNKLLGDGFNSRFTDRMREKLTGLNERLSTMMAKNGYSQEYIDSHQMTIREIVIVASMIEKESGGADESYTISSVIYNRLTNPDYPHLQIDATVVYALGGKTDPLTEEDLLIDSPYNSYLHDGLIPGPISNPGRESLNAALEPEDTTYYFYALNPETGRHHFSSTLGEHEEFLKGLESGE